MESNVDKTDNNISELVSSYSRGSETVRIDSTLTNLQPKMNICDLPECALLRVFHYLDIRTLVLVVRKSCGLWHSLSYDRSLWKVLKLDFGGFGEKMGDVSFLKMLTQIADLVEEVVFGFTMLLTDESFMHKNIYLSNIKLMDFSLTNVTTNAVVFLTDKYPNLTALNLNHCSYINIYKCLDFVGKFKNLKYLSFEDFACPAESHRLNLKILKTFQSCQFIEGADIYTTDLSDLTLSGIFECSSKLTEIDLTGADKISVDGFKSLNKSIHSLMHLSIAYTLIDDKCLKVICENAPKLKSLNIMSCVYITDVGIGYVASNCKELESILFNKTDPEEKGCSITSNGLEMVALGCPKLRILYVSYCLLIDDKCIIAVAKNCPNLSELRLAGCLSITDQSLMTLGKHSHYLRDLEVSECAQLTSKGVAFLVAQCRWLHSLSLETCHRVSDINISMYRNLQDVRRSDSDEPDETDGCMSSDDASASSDGHPSPTDLDLQCSLAPGESDCVLTKVEADPAEDRAVAGTQNEELSTCIKYAETDKILMSLHNHSHLHSLHLSFCSKITNETIIDIAKNCPDLQELSLRGCHLITDIAIATLVRSCEFIRILDISGGSSFFSMKISSVSLSAIAHDCKYIERLMISKNKLINLSGLEVLFNMCTSLQSLELTVGEPMYASFSGVMSLINNIKDRIVKIANQVQVIANKQSGNLHIEFYPNAESNLVPIHHSVEELSVGEYLFG